jgi:IclR family pca regulon transcriptional regulator
LPLLSYAFVLLNTLEVRRIALSYLHELHRDLEATVSLGVRDGSEVVLVERQSLAGPWVPPGGFEIGFRLPMHASATGLVILAFLAPDEIESVLSGLELKVRTPHTLRTPAALDQRLAEIRRLGYATSDEELAVGLRSVAVPIIGAQGGAVAAISLARATRPARSISIDELIDQFVPKLQGVAERISTALGHRPFVTPDANS